MTNAVGIHKFSAQRLKKSFGLALTVALTLGFTTNLGVAGSSANTRSSEKVTICHRTSAVTNPYRMITVSVNSIVSNNGHDNTVHNHEVDGANPGVFNPDIQYAANAKKWEDIIPAFYYNETQGGTVTRTFFAGRNWNTEGKAIFYGIGNKAGLCGASGAKEFAQGDYAEWLNDFPGLNNNNQPSNGDITSKKRAIINDLKDQGNIDDGDLSSFTTDFDALPATPRKPKGPNRPQAFTELITEVENYNTTNPSAPLNQALAGVVWKDLDNDGIQDAGEETFANLPIQIIDPDTGLPLTSTELAGLTQLASSVSLNQPLFTFAGLAKDSTVFKTAANVVTLTTDENGYFEVPSLPEGDWQVNVITPDGWSYTYDSSGSNDGQMPGTYVPAGGAGFAWAGLVFLGNTAPDDSEEAISGLPATGVDLSWAFQIFAVLMATGATLVLMGRRKPKEQESGTSDY